MIKYKMTFKDGSYIEFASLEAAEKYKKDHKISNQVNQVTEPDPTHEDVLSNLENKAPEYRLFGYQLYDKVNDKTWAKNTFLKSIGQPLTTQQMQSLLATSTSLEKALKSGSFLTAIDVAKLLQKQLPQYAEIAQFVINELNTFMGKK